MKWNANAGNEKKKKTANNVQQQERRRRLKHENLCTGVSI